MKPPLKNFNLTPASTKGGLVSQLFGLNPRLYAPLGLLGHNGIDFVQPHGSPMYAIEGAYVVDVKDDPRGFGKHVRLISRHRDENGNHNEWTYGHCSKIHVKQNETVKAGDHIADMGNTGFVVSNATGNGFWTVNPYAGTHLHLGLRKIKRDAKGWSYSGSTFKITVQNHQNGYRGSIDPYDTLLPLVQGVTKTDNDPRIPLLKQVLHLLQQKYNLLSGKR